MTKTAAAVSDTDLEKCLRGWSKVLSLWRLCGNAACRRARRCRGEAHVCLPKNFQLLPQGVRDWFVDLAAAQECDIPFDAAIESLDASPAGQAFHDWNAAVAASLGEAEEAPAAQTTGPAER